METFAVLDSNLYRLFDAAANRAGEGLRVVEDYARFVLDDGHLTEQWKCLRHDLTKVLAAVDTSARAVARQTQQDVGTRISMQDERQRVGFEDLVAANVARATQALRSLEESSKLFDEDLAVCLESIRYRCYTLAAATQTTGDSVHRLANVSLCVLVDGCQSQDDFRKLVQRLVAAGVGAIQLRDKRLDDIELLERARMLRLLTAGNETLFVMNDRPDLAVLARADGVHVGQTELPVKDVRQLVGVDCLIGVSTHNIDQARGAVLDGANYIGIGPTFPSQTKSFEDFPGLELLRQVAAEIRLPAFAIGGINVQNAVEVVETGIHRLAVASAVTTAADPAQVAGDLMRIVEMPVVAK